MNKFYRTIGSVAFSLLVVSSAVAAQPALSPALPDLFDAELQAEDYLVLVQDSGEQATVAISAREAANIALSAVPGAKVLKVKLLNSSVYAVTLRGDGTLTRVMVDANTGAIQ